MSGGQQQRVGIARAFISNPDIVLLMSLLVTGFKDNKEVMDLIKQMAEENNLTIVMVTHDVGLTKYADRSIHILDGKIQEKQVETA